MNNVKIFAVRQGANSYDNVAEVTFLFLDYSAARSKFEALREEVVVDVSLDDIVFTTLHAVAPGDEIEQGNMIDSH
jgi:hypothetical protein